MLPSVGTSLGQSITLVAVTQPITEEKGAEKKGEVTYINWMALWSVGRTNLFLIIAFVETVKWANKSSKDCTWSAVPDALHGVIAEGVE